MPIWTEPELEMIQSEFPNSAEEDWRNRFKYLGGVPRLIFERTSNTPKVILEAACSPSFRDDCIRLVDSDSMMTERSLVHHSLVHITSSPPHTTYTITYMHLLKP